MGGSPGGAPIGEAADPSEASFEPALREEVQALAAAQGWPRVERGAVVGRAFGGALVGAWIGLLLLVAGNRFQDMDRIVALILGGDPIALGFMVVPTLIMAGVGVLSRPRAIAAGEEAWRAWLATAKSSDLEYARRRLTEL